MTTLTLTLTHVLRRGGATLLLAACATTALADGVPAPAPDSAATLRALEQALGDGACDSAAQCHTVAIGHKACGGPERYATWSSKTADAKRVALLARQHANARRAEDQGKGAISTCSAVRDPGATCSAGRCVPAGGTAPVPM